jgi:hypothetical protein
LGVAGLGSAAGTAGGNAIATVILASMDDARDLAPVAVNLRYMLVPADLTAMRVAAEPQMPRVPQDGVEIVIPPDLGDILVESDEDDVYP